MSNIHRLPSQQAAMHEASGWIARIDRGLSEEEERQLRDWLAGGAANLRALMQAARLYDQLDSMSRLADLFPKPQPQRRRWLVPMGLAAAVCAAVLIGFYIALPRPDALAVLRAPQGSTSQSARQTSLSTAVGERRTVDLPDGSQLSLNTDTLIRTMFTAGSRSLFLERGEVHVQVAHDRRRPFNVYIGSRFVQAVGTEFNLRISDDDRVELLVTEGKVLVGLRESPSASPAEPERLISAGKRIVLGAAADPVEQLTPEDIVVKLSWRSGNLVFRGESLAEAIDEIERYTRVEFVISDESLKKIRVAGLFKTGDVDGLLRTLEENFNVSYRRVGDDKIILASSDTAAR